jgi:hypothetical protein
LLRETRAAGNIPHDLIATCLTLPDEAANEAQGNQQERNQNTHRDQF